MKRVSLLTALLCAVLAFPGCGGGGGGGGEFIGAAIIEISASPRSIDTGDRLEVTADISEVDRNGILVKFRYPSGLTYVLSSAFLRVGANRADVGPAINTPAGDQTDSQYLVFFFSRDQFGAQNRGTLTFELEGAAEFEEGAIEVDPDVNDPLIDDAQEFSASSPEFSSEAEVSVDVVG